MEFGERSSSGSTAATPSTLRRKIMTKLVGSGTTDHDSRLGIEDLTTQTFSSTPTSPRLSRLGKVTKLISRSDANLHKSKAKRSRHLSGDSNEPNAILSQFNNTKDIMNQNSFTSNSTTGSPSKGFLSKASGYVNHLKSRITKHKDKTREKDYSSSSSLRSPSHHHQNHPHSTHLQIQSLSSCCGHSREIDSLDTLAGLQDGSPGGSNPASSLKEKENTNGNSSFVSGSLSVNVSSSRIVGGGGESLGAGDTTGSSLCNPSTASNNNPFMSSSDLPTRTNMVKPTVNLLTTAGPTTSFYTLNVYLLRGKNLVARDACGSSDPYVKVKIGDKLYFKSKTVYKDLNPIWDESFTLPINDLTHPVIFKVFDYDWGFQDDFMGMTSLDLREVEPFKAHELTLKLTENNAPGENPMGEIVLTVTLVPRTAEEKELLYCISQPIPKSLRSTIHNKFDNSIKWIDGQNPGKVGDSQKRLKSQIWSSVLTVLLLEAKVPPPENESEQITNAYVKFRLGNQKFKSRSSPNCKWREQFDLYMYEGNPQVLEVQVYDEASSRDYIGRCSIDIGLLEKEITHSVNVPLLESLGGEISFLLTVSGTFGAETISDLTNYNPSTEEESMIKNRYALTKSFQNLKDVGHLTVKVYEARGLAAADFNQKSDPFVVLELVNARLQTQTEYRTLNPTWNKIFTFAVKDITTVLEVTVYDEDRHHKTEFLGKITIPLWKITNGEKKWFVLKDRKLIRQAKGSNPQILLEMNLEWNPIRAGLRVMDPPETKFIEPDQRLNREIFLLNIDRLRKIGVGIYDVMQYIQSCMEWEYPVRSIIALILYQVICYTFEPFMIPLFFLILILKPWLISAVTGTPLPEEYPEDGETLVLDDDDDESGNPAGDGEEKKMSLRQKLQAVQDATQTLQNALGHIASICESTRNTFRMVVPFVSWLAILGLFVATSVLYFIPVRYLAMAWGLHRFMRPLLRPNVKPTDEVYNLLLRVPDNQDLIYLKPLRAVAIPEQQGTPSRTRSPPAKTPAQKKKHKFW